MYTNRAHCRALRLMFALRKEQAYFINLNGICLRLRPKGVQGASGKPPASGMIRQLCRNQFPVGGRVGFDIPWVSRQLRCPKVSKGRAESPLVRPQAHTPCHGGEGRADYGAGVGLAVSWGAHTFLSMAKEKCAKESQRHGDYRGGPPRCASRASVCGSRTVGRPEFIRGVQFRPLGRNSLTTFRGQTALRGCPRPRFALLTRRDKGSYCPFCRRGSQCRAQ